MRIKRLYAESIVKLKDGRVCKILDVKYKPIEIKALDVDSNKGLVLRFKDIDKVLYEKPMIDTVIEFLPVVGTYMLVVTLSGLLRRISEKIEEKGEVKD